MNVYETHKPVRSILHIRYSIVARIEKKYHYKDQK